MRKQRLAASMLALCLLLMAGCTKQNPPQAQETPQESPAAQRYDFADILSFDVTLLDGRELSAAQLFAGKDVTVINFWATWCPPCVEEMGSLAAFEKTLPDNVQLITYCLDAEENRKDCEDILSKNDYTGATIASAGGDILSVLDSMQYVPTTLFVDGEGRLVCDSLIGAPTDLAAEYTQRINDALKAAGKSEM